MPLDAVVVFTPPLACQCGAAAVGMPMPGGHPLPQRCSSSSAGGMRGVHGDNVGDPALHLRASRRLLRLLAAVLSSRRKRPAHPAAAPCVHCRRGGPHVAQTQVQQGFSTNCTCIGHGCKAVALMADVLGFLPAPLHVGRVQGVCARMVGEREGGEEGRVGVAP
jgi:hypothetical protein